MSFNSVLKKIFGIKPPEDPNKPKTPKEKAKDFVDDYELTPAYSYEGVNGEVKVIEKPWVVNDDDGVPSYSLLPQAVAVSLIKQMIPVLGL